MFKKNKKKKNLFLKLLFGGGVIGTIMMFSLMIVVLMIFDFFTPIVSSSSAESPSDESNLGAPGSYKYILNKYMKNGYVSWSRLKYFYLSNAIGISLDDVYLMSQDQQTKSYKSYADICKDPRVSFSTACANADTDGKKFNEKPNQLFNFPLDTTDYQITSYVNEARNVYGKTDVHNGWDFRVGAGTPVYSPCNGVVTKVNFTQQQNVPYNQSHNQIGNQLTIQCNDYGEIYYVIFAHLFPNSSKVSVGQAVGHYTEVANVGTTGWSTGNHLHFEVRNKNKKIVDGMMLVNLNYAK